MGYLLIDDEKATNRMEMAAATAVATTTKAALKADRSRSNDAASSSSMFVSHPSEMDVLCGQDKNFIQHPGNRLYRSLIATWSERYGRTVDKQSKMRMTTEICEHMKKTYESRFLKPTPVMVMDEGGEAAESRKSNTHHVREAAVSSSTTTDLGAFRWKVLTDQAARDKISHALRTAVTASRQRQERRKRMKAAQKKEQQNQQQQHRPTHSEQKQQQQRKQQQHQQQQNIHQPQARFVVDETWMAPHPSMHGDCMPLSFATVPGTPPHAVWRHEQTTDSYTTTYEPLPMPSPVSFDGSTDTTASSSWSSPLLFLDDADAAIARHATTNAHHHHHHHHWNDSQNYEPLPWSLCRGSFTLSTEMATSLSQILSDDSDFSCVDW